MRLRLIAPHAPHQPQPAAVQLPQQQAGRTRYPRQRRLHLGHCQHHGQAFALPGRYDVAQPRQVDIQYSPIKKQQCTLGLVLGRRRHPAHHGQMRQKRLDLGRAHVPRVPLAVEQDEPTYPIDVRILGTDAVVQPPDAGTHLIQELPPGRPTRGVIDMCFEVYYHV